MNIYIFNSNGMPQVDYTQRKKRAVVTGSPEIIKRLYEARYGVES